MKYVSILIALLVFSCAAYGAPYLVSDPTDQAITECKMVWNGTEYTFPPVDLGNGTVKISYDLASIWAPGPYVAEVSWTDGVWGWSETITLSATAGTTAPGGVCISPNP